MAVNRLNIDEWENLLPAHVMGSLDKGSTGSGAGPSYMPSRISLQAGAITADGRTLNQVVANGVRRMGGEIRVAEVQAILTEGKRVTGVRCAGGDIAADQIVLADGRPRVRPVEPGGEILHQERRRHHQRSDEAAARLVVAAQEQVDAHRQRQREDDPARRHEHRRMALGRMRARRRDSMKLWLMGSIVSQMHDVAGRNGEQLASTVGLNQNASSFV